MKKKTNTPKFKISPETLAKNMKKQLGEYDAQRVAKSIVSSGKNFSGNDVNLKDIFDLNEVKRNQQLWQQVLGILSK